MAKKKASEADKEILMDMAASVWPRNYKRLSDGERIYYFTLRYEAFLEQFIAGNLTLIDKDQAHNSLDEVMKKKQ